MNGGKKQSLIYHNWSLNGKYVALQDNNSLSRQHAQENEHMEVRTAHSWMTRTTNHSIKIYHGSKNPSA